MSVTVVWISSAAEADFFAVLDGTTEVVPLPSDCGLGHRGNGDVIGAECGGVAGAKARSDWGWVTRR